MTALRRFLLLACCTPGIIGHPARAQEAAAAQNPAATAAQATGAAEQSGDLFPSSGPAQPPPAGRARSSRLLGNKNKRNARATDLIASEADSDPLEVRVAYRRAKTLAMAQDPEMDDLLQRAANAPNAREKRAWLKQYYARLFADVKKIDPSPGLAAHVALLQIIARQRYDPQRRSIAGEEDLANGVTGRR